MLPKSEGLLYDVNVEKMQKGTEWTVVNAEEWKQHMRNTPYAQYININIYISIMLALSYTYYYLRFNVHTLTYTHARTLYSAQNLDKEQKEKYK